MTSDDDDKKPAPSQPRPLNHREGAGKARRGDEHEMSDDDDDLPIVRQHEPLSILGILFMNAGFNIRRRDDQKELIAALRFLKELSALKLDLEFLKDLRAKDAARRDVLKMFQRAAMGALVSGLLAGLSGWFFYLFPHLGGK